ncbi:MAG: YfhO family protein [Clostridia bacterium]|nr:YfhO family protein [Clostridia bacterium]
MNEVSKKFNPLKKLREILVTAQNKISCSSSSYLAYSFIVPVALIYLIYLSMGIHPFGNGSVLVLDLNGQYVYFFESLKNAIQGETSFLYTFSRALGGEYMGMYAYYLASPLSYIVALFPDGYMLEALLVMILLKIGLCGLCFGIYLHKNSAHPNKIMVVAFSAMYALCAYTVVHHNNIMWIDAVFWLPLITYGIEQLIKNRRYKLFVISLALAIMSNYYIGYMVCIYCVIYFFYFYTAHGEEIRNPHAEKKHGIKSFLRFGLFSVLSAAISTVILLAAYYSLTFGKNDFSNPSWALKAKFDLLDFFTKFLPGTYDTVRPEGLPFVYCGLLVLFMIPVYFTARAIKTREKIASLALLCFFVICFIASPLDLIWHGFQNPNWLNHRYSFMFCFVLLVLGYKGFGNLRQFNEKFILATSAFIILFTAVCQKNEFETYVVSDEKLATFYTVWVTVLITIILFAVLCVLMRTKKPKMREGVTAILASVICIELFCNAIALTVQFDDDVTYSNYSGYNEYIGGLLPVVEELNEYDTSFYRAEKTIFRKFNDNMALGLRGLSNSTSTLNASQIKFLGNMGYASRSHLSRYLGGTPVSDSLLDVKYVIDYSNSEKLSHYYNEVISGEKYDVYENPYSLSLAYGVSENVNEFKFESYKTYFEKQNALVGALCGYDAVPEIYKPIKEYKRSNSGCTVVSNYNNTTFTPTDEETTATVSFSFVANEAAEYYFYTPSNSPKECTIKVNKKNLGKYLGNDTRCIVSLGWFEAGEEVNVKMTLQDSSLSINNGCDYIWYIDRPIFEECFADLSDNPMFISNDNCKDDYITGSITTVENGSMIMTSIPYDEGWNIYVDGEQVETYKTLDALIAFDIADVGEHSIEFKYSPRIYKVGFIISLMGISTFIIFCVADLVLKRTLFKSRLEQDIITPWTLEDFDEDYEQLLSQSVEPKDKEKSKKKRFFKFNKK